MFLSFHNARVEKNHDGTTFQVTNGMLQVTFYELKQDLNTCRLRVIAGRNVNTQSEIHNTGKVGGIEESHTKRAHFAPI